MQEHPTARASDAGRPAATSDTAPGRKAKPGTGQIGAVALSVPAGSLPFWKQRLTAHALDGTEGERFGERFLRLSHPCGIRYELSAVDRDPREPYSNGAVPAEHGIRAIRPLPRPGTPPYTRGGAVMEPFVYSALSSRVVFGSGSVARLGDELDRLGVKRALILSTLAQRELAERAAKDVGGRAAGVFAGAVMHTPVHVTEQALTEVRARGADGLVAIGGGSTTGLGKALALRTDLPQLVVPTTYAGSEMTPILGETKEGVKTTTRSPKVLPEVVLYDVDLTMSLPPALSGTSGINAIAHAVEALYAQDRNPVTSLMAEEGIRALAGALPTLARAPDDREAREAALYGAWLCGTCLGAVGMALHHKLCHTLGGSFDLPHAETHTVVLPHATAFNAPAAPSAVKAVARALGREDAAGGLYALAGEVGAARALRDLGMPEAAIDRATELALASPYWNPRPLERSAVRDLLSRAWAGEPPQPP